MPALGTQGPLIAAGTSENGRTSLILGESRPGTVGTTWPVGQQGYCSHLCPFLGEAQGAREGKALV